MVRESKSPHSTPTFCVRKPNGKWRLVHVYNKLNNATVPAQTPIPRKDALLNNMSGCTLYSALDLVDGYYQILMRESDIPLTAVSTPSGMLCEWLMMPQGLSNAPATFNRLVTQLFRPLRTFAQTYFDDIFVHSRAEGGQMAMEVHLKHLRRVLEVMRANKLYANIDKCDFAAEEIKVLGCFVSRVGVQYSASDSTVFHGEPECMKFKPVISLNGYQYTKAGTSSKKVTNRRSFYRRKEKCKSRVDFMVEHMAFTNFREHVCHQGVVVPNVCNVEKEMKATVDELVLQNLSMSTERVWDSVREIFYLSDNVAVHGLTRDQYFGGSMHGLVEVPPLFMVQGTAMTFFQFHRE
ncbi:hypothetical protein PHPALM_30945 [Phytophthora palmivora]|uniref:Reverse transcriptase domain-containing protein n=1 Tax=Phytophthora palmivora TaxID=4796 RepID=A0A2P4X3U6_9STRA|nr:hypothetical protein PHPALM_30945 [Phytophthora palmivora]